MVPFVIAHLALIALQTPPTVELSGHALLPADTFAAGPASGARVPPTRGTTPPFASQPVQGFSALAALRMSVVL